ncbi:MAG: LamG domain-containing protein [Acidimicrobiales bacterium]
MIQPKVQYWARRGLSSFGLSIALLVATASAVDASPFGASVLSNSLFSTGTMQIEGTTAGPNNCYSTGSGSGGSVTASNMQPCAIGSPISTGELSSTASSAATTTLTSVGTVNASSSMIASASCGVSELADSASATDWSGTGPDTALSFAGLTYQASGPVNSQAITTDGSTGWAETTTEYTNPETFTVLAWFKTSSAQGSIVGFSSSQDPIATTPASHDRSLWVDSSGKLDWGINNGSQHELTSTSAVDTGSWVFAAASVGSAGTALYVNGSKVSSAAGVTTSQSYSGWWSIGYADLASWADIPSNYYFKGSLAQLAIVPSQLSAAQVTALYGDSTLSSYTTGVNALSPASYWALNDSGSVPYERSVPGVTASTTLVDASGNANTGTAEGGVSLGVAGPTSLGAGAISLNGSTGYVETATSYLSPTGISEAAWFKTSSASGGTIISMTDARTDSATSDWDRTVWLDNSGHVVYEVWNTSLQELTSPSTYNDGQWHFVVAEIGSLGERLWVDGTLVAQNASVTSTVTYTGYWHLGWGDETSYSDPPTDSFFSGSLAQAAVVPSQLTTSQISILYNSNSAAAFALDVGELSPTSYWPLGDSASNICGTTEVTVQQTVGGAKTCIYPSAAGTCVAPSSSVLLPSLGVRSITAAVAGTPVTITVTMKLSAVSPAGVLGLHELVDMGFGTTRPSTLWSAGVHYPLASVEL